MDNSVVRFGESELPRRLYIVVAYYRSEANLNENSKGKYLKVDQS